MPVSQPEQGGLSRTSRFTVPPTMAHAGDHSLLVHIQTGAMWIKNFHVVLLARRRREPHLVNSNKRAPRSLPSRGTIRDAQALLVQLKHGLAGTKRYADLSADDAPKAFHSRGSAQAGAKLGGN
jgi:hypothetical protein